MFEKTKKKLANIKAKLLPAKPVVVPELNIPVQESLPVVKPTRNERRAERRKLGIMAGPRKPRFWVKQRKAKRKAQRLARRIQRGK